MWVGTIVTPATNLSLSIQSPITLVTKCAQVNTQIVKHNSLEVSKFIIRLDLYQFYYKVFNFNNFFLSKVSVATNHKTIVSLSRQMFFK